MVSEIGHLNAKSYFARRLIVHVHLQKTGGTSFVSGLQKIFGLQHVYDMRGGKKPPAEMDRSDIIKIWALSGHFWFDTQERPIARKKTYFMCFRDPVDRFISLYNYVANSAAHPGHNKFGILDIEGAFQYLKKNNRAGIANTMSLMFGARAKGPPRQPGRIVSKGEYIPFELARDRIEENFSLFVPMLRVDDALKQIAQVFGCGEMTFERENIGKKLITSIPDHVREELISMNSEDIKLIKHFESVFDDHIADLKNRLSR